jgi:hypothetical protein
MSRRDGEKRWRKEKDNLLEMMTTIWEGVRLGVEHTVGVWLSSMAAVHIVPILQSLSAALLDDFQCLTELTAKGRERLFLDELDQLDPFAVSVSGLDWLRIEPSKPQQRPQLCRGADRRRIMFPLPLLLRPRWGLYISKAWC